MKKIRVLNIVFDTEIKSYEIPAFRGAIVEKAGKENTLFHNHLAGKGFLYKYPLIQYKQINKKPAIFCIEYGIDEIHKYFEKKDWNIKISGRWLDMKILRLHMNRFTMQVWDKMFSYSVKNWIALNQTNYKKFLQMQELTERITFLENILKANILSFAKGIEWTVEKQIKIKINDMRETRPAVVKGEKLLGFNLDFSSNVFLPEYIGLGKSVSLGYGIVRPLRKYNDKN